MCQYTSVLTQVHPDTGISNKTMAILSSFVNDIFQRIATEASSRTSRVFSLIYIGFAYIFCSFSYLELVSSTISSQEIQISVRLIPQILPKHATKSVTSMYLALIQMRMLIVLHIASSNRILVSRGIGRSPTTCRMEKKDELSKVQRIQQHKVPRKCRCAFLQKPLLTRRNPLSAGLPFCRTHCLLEEIHYLPLRNSSFYQC